MTTVRDIETFLYAWAPRETAESWDNVGLLVGRGDREVRRVLAALDVTPAVAAEAAEQGADLIVAHHPVMNVRWHEQEMQTLRDDTRLGGLLTYLVRHDLSAICMHTNLDAAEGGVNDQLAWALGLTDTIPLNEQKIGRIGTLSCEKPLEQFLHDVVKSLGCRGLRYRGGGRPCTGWPWAAGPAANISPRRWPRGAIPLSPATCGITTFWIPRASTSSTRGTSPRRMWCAPRWCAACKKRFPISASQNRRSITTPCNTT